ncbi:MAG: (2Fe-2S)-binding protein [Deltaproteobacteria bacterium]|nr:(2Fe-2S)-binding protein [Deltaproteobacteria bacterium]
MIVCLCANVSERELVETITAGATTVKEIGRRCGAGTGCGGCKPLIRECLARCRAAVARESAYAADAAPLAAGQV